MAGDTGSLLTVYEGWDGYQHALSGALAPLTPEQLVWRPATQLRSPGELVAMLGMLGLENFELGDVGGHTIEPPLAG
jgi:hypothetical protein